MRKNASSKGKDKVRANWQERWFVLRKHRLLYFKKKADSKPKGEIDMRSVDQD